jgi:hypothetical protein
MLVLLAACDRSPGTAPAPASQTGDSWIRGDIDQRFAIVAKQLRGFDAAMVETGYRYGELYWAGEDRNWEYAAYQLEKIETAIANGLERRPKRAASAARLTPALERVRASLHPLHGTWLASSPHSTPSKCFDSVKVAGATADVGTAAERHAPSIKVPMDASRRLRRAHAFRAPAELTPSQGAGATASWPPRARSRRGRSRARGRAACRYRAAFSSHSCGSS